ncbi:MAG: DPP IV N-terminal domain-containing protein [Actinomycetota bacterium]
MRLFKVKVSVALAGVFMILGTVSASATPPGDNGDIVFSRSLGAGRTQIVSMSEDGFDSVVLTSGPQTKTGPTWSPDGTMVAYTAFKSVGKGRIVILDLESGERRRVIAPRSRWSEEDPAWSPNGRRLAFVRYRYIRGQPRPPDVWAVSINGTNLTRVTRRGANTDPAWSPDGRRIAFVSEQTFGGVHVHTVNVGTGKVKQVTAGSASDAFPTWSPDGSRIAFLRSRDVFATTLGTSSTVQITHLGSRRAFEPVWSPDGKWIAFAAIAHTLRESAIWKVAVDDEEIVRLTTSTRDRFRREPDWVPEALGVPDLVGVTG